MAERDGALRPAMTMRAPAMLALALLAAALLAGFLPVLWMGAAQGFARLDAYVLRVLGFTLLQAGLSTLLSVALGLPLARALARRQFPGRGLVTRLLNLPLALPAIVVIIGIVEVYGRTGWFGGVFDIYGLQGILLAHVFFNVPLAARLLLAEFERIPPESWKLAAQMDFGSGAVWRFIEWPQVKGSLPGVALLIFLLCASSFAVVLTLGGGPRATTLEVAIYQSLRADFDPARAASLAMVQLALCVSLTLLAQRWGGVMKGWPALRIAARRFDGSSPASLAADVTLIGLGLLLLVPPLAALAVSGAANLDPGLSFLKSLATSLALGASSAAVAMAIVWPLAQQAARHGSWRRWAGLSVLASWIVPPAVLATGWFILLVARADLAGLAPALVIAMNAMMTLPFVFQTLAPAIARQAEAHDQLCASLNLSGWNRFRLIDVAVLKRPIGLALVLAFILSLGDLTAISLFGSQDLVTLPALIYRQMGSYRFDEAIGTALLLGLLVLACTALAERWSSRS